MTRIIFYEAAARQRQTFKSPFCSAALSPIKFIEKKSFVETKNEQQNNRNKSAGKSEENVAGVVKATQPLPIAICISRDSRALCV